MTNRSDQSRGVSFLGLLTILFIGLKLTGFISWSWFWVLSPLLIPIIVLIFVILVLSINEKF